MYVYVWLENESPICFLVSQLGIYTLVSQYEWWVAGVVQWLPVSDTYDPLTLGTCVWDQVPPPAPSLVAGGSSRRWPLAGLKEVLPAAADNVPLHLRVSRLSSAPGHTHCLPTQGTLWDSAL